MLLVGIIDELEEVLKRAKQLASHATALSYFFYQDTAAFKAHCQENTCRVKWIVSSRNWDEAEE